MTGSSPTVKPVRYYPVNLDLRGRLVTAIGGGEVAFRKVESLLESGARVRVVASVPGVGIRRLARRKKIRLAVRPYRPGDLGNSFAAIAATDDRALNVRIRGEALQKRILLNIVDKPEFCDFVFPSRVQRGEFLLTVSTGGGSPAFSKKIRRELEGKFGEEYGRMVEILGKIRRRLPRVNRQAAKRFTSFVRSPVLPLIRRRNRAGVNRLLKRHFGDGLSLRSLGVRL